MNTIKDHVHYKVTKLFLDDIRSLYDVFNYTKDPIYTFPNWDIVRSYDEFVEYILQNGVPNIWSIDHDLADVHYELHNTSTTMEELQNKWEIYHNNPDHEKTGYDCLKWLIDYCHEKMIVFPKIYIHTMNTVGYRNMVHYYNSAIKNKFIKLN